MGDAYSTVARSGAMLHPRLLAVFLPPLVLIADFGSSWLLSAAALSLIVVHLMNSLFPSEVGFIALWVATMVQVVGQCISVFTVLGVSARAFFLAGLIGCVVFLFGLWASLQYEFLREESAPVALLGERHEVAPRAARLHKAPSHSHSQSLCHTSRRTSELRERKMRPIRARTRDATARRVARRWHGDPPRAPLRARRRTPPVRAAAAPRGRGLCVGRGRVLRRAHHPIRAAAGARPQLLRMHGKGGVRSRESRRPGARTRRSVGGRPWAEHAIQQGGRRRCRGGR